MTVAKLLNHVPVYHYPSSFPSLLSQIGITKRFLILWRSEGVLELLYSRRPHMVARSSLGASALATAVAAGEEADDDATEADDGADDGLEDAADTANNSHDCISNGLEARFDLLNRLSVEVEDKVVAMVAYARNNTAHFG